MCQMENFVKGKLWINKTISQFHQMTKLNLNGSKITKHLNKRTNNSNGLNFTKEKTKIN